MSSHEKAQKGTKSPGPFSTGSAGVPPASIPSPLTPFPPVKTGLGSSVQNGSGSALVVAGERPADIVAFEREVVSFFVDAADLLGVPKSVAAIYGICFASPEPLSFSDIDERLDISSGSISQGLRVLKEVGALKVAGLAPARNPLSVIRGSTDLLDATSGNESKHRNVSQEATEETEKCPLPKGAKATNNELPVTSAELRVPNHELRITARSTACYEPDLELRKLILRWLENRLQNELKSGQSRLKTIMSSIPASLDQPDALLRTRFESLQTWHDKASALLPIVKTFLKLT